MCSLVEGGFAACWSGWWQLDVRFCSAGDIPTIHKTSPLDLNATDPQGMTAFHHAVFSLDFGSFDNGDIIKVLMAANGDPNKPDMRGELPKDSALMRGATRIYNALQPNVSNHSWQVGGKGQGLSPTKIGCKVSPDFLDVETLNVQTGSGRVVKTRSAIIADSHAVIPLALVFIHHFNWHRLVFSISTFLHHTLLCSFRAVRLWP